VRTTLPTISCVLAPDRSRLLRLDGLLARPAIRHHENRKLLAHLRRERAHLFTFLSEPGIPATN
jgi:hypothetical protein